MRLTFAQLTILIILGGFFADVIQAQPKNKILPVPVEQAEPDYPPELKQAKIEGEVVVEFTVTDIGFVKSAKIHSSTHPAFEEPALNAVKQWLFEPGSRNGVTTAMRMRVPVIFKVPPDYLSTTLFEIPPGDRPEQWTYDTLPRMQSIGQAVYPFDALIENKRANVECVITINQEGRVIEINWPREVDAPFRESIAAVLDTARLTPAKREGKPIETGMILKLVYHPYDGDVKISDAAAAILKKLRIAGEEAHFVSKAELDAPLIALKKSEPLFPTAIPLTVQNGNALIEFYIDQSGNAQLPRIVEASAPAFGYAACQAISEWKFEPPLKEGKPVVVKVRVPVVFKRE